MSQKGYITVKCCGCKDTFKTQTSLLPRDMIGYCANQGKFFKMVSRSKLPDHVK